MSAMRTPLPFWDHTEELPCVTDDEVRAFDAEIDGEALSSLSSFRSVPTQQRLAVCIAVPGKCLYDAGKLRGLVCMALRPAVGNHLQDRMECVIHTLWVREEHRRKGIGKTALARAHAFAAAFAQLWQAPQPLAAKPNLQWSLARGSCRRRPSTLLLLDSAGWRVVRDAEKSVPRADLLRWTEENRDMSALDIEVHGPNVPLYLPLLQPGSTTGLHQFKPPHALEGPPPRESRWLRPYAVNLELLQGQRALLRSTGVMPLRNKGLLPFLAPLYACRELEAYLSDTSNHLFTRTGDNTIRHTLPVEDVEMVGYFQYGVLNVPHLPDLQSCRTLRTVGCRPADFACLLRCLPGLSVVLLSATRALGLPALSEQELSVMLKHLHFLLLDGSSQVDFGWHEDTYDLAVLPAQKDDVISIIVQLGDAFSTAMQIYLFPYHEYLGQGAGVLFPGRCVHRSVSRRSMPCNRAVWKVAAFLVPPSDLKRKFGDLKLGAV